MNIGTSLLGLCRASLFCIMCYGWAKRDVRCVETHPTGCVAAPFMGRFDRLDKSSSYNYRCGSMNRATTGYFCGDRVYSC